MSNPENQDFQNTISCLTEMMAQLECVKCLELPKDKIWMPSTCNHKYCQLCIQELTDNKCQICQNFSNPKDRVHDLFSSNLLSELLLFEKQLDYEKSSSSLLKNQESKSTPQPSFVVPEIPRKVTPQRPKNRYKSFASTPPIIAKFFDDEDDDEEDDMEEEEDKCVSPPILTQYNPEKQQQQQQQGSTTPTSTKQITSPTVNTSTSSSNGEPAPILSPQGLQKLSQKEKQKKSTSKKETENKIVEEINIIGENSTRPRRSSTTSAQKHMDTSTTSIKTKQNEMDIIKSVKNTTTTSEKPSTSTVASDLTSNSSCSSSLNNLDQQVEEMEEEEDDDTTSNDESNTKDLKNKNREKSNTMDKTVSKISKIFKLPRSNKNKTINLKPDGEVKEKPKKGQTNFSFFTISNKTRATKSVTNSTINSNTTTSTSKVELSNEEIMSKKPIVPITKLTMNEIKAKLKKTNKKDKKDDDNDDNSNIQQTDKKTSKELEKESDSQGSTSKKRGPKKSATKNDKIDDDVISTTTKNVTTSSSASTTITKNVTSNVTKIKQETIEKHSPLQIPITRRSRKTSTSSSICGDGSPVSLNSPKLDKRNAKGETKLFIASRLGQLEKAKQLINDGCDVDATDFAGWTPIHEAITGKKGGLEMVKILCKAGCNVNALGMNNETPLHSACRYNAVQIVEHLLSCSASSAIRNKDGKLPRDLTTSEAVIKLLDEHELKIAETPCSLEGDVTEMPLELKVSFEKAIFYFAFEPSNDLREKCKQLRMNISNELRSEVTHVVFDAKAKEKVELSLDYLLSLLAGTWMLSLQWLEDSLKHGKFLNPSKYTIGGCQISDITEIDSSSENSSIEKARINREHGNPGLFSGMNFYIYKNTSWSIKNADSSKSSTILTLNKKDITRLIQAGGGIAINREPNPDTVDPLEFPVRFHATRSDNKDHKLNFTSYVILYNESNMPPKIHDFEHFKTLKIDWLLHSCISFQLIEPDNNYN